jgi:DNA polymerase III epsilon subunit-like protein
MTIVFDCETTGLADFSKPPEHECQPRLVQLGALLLDSDLQTVGEINLIVKPEGFTIPVEASNIHGITQEKAEKVGITESHILYIFEEWCAKAETLVAHNIQFDGIVLGRANHIRGFAYTPPKPYCTMKAATPICKLPGRNGQYKWPSLMEAHQILLGTGFEGAHDAMADVRACARIYERLIHDDRPLARPVEQQKAPPLSEHDLPDAPYDDNTPMPFGKWTGTPLGKLDESYCNWLYDQDNLSDRRLYKWLHGND